MTTFSLPSMAYVMLESQTRNNAVAALFSAALTSGQNRRLWAMLTRRPNALRHLPAATGRQLGGHHAGRRLVAIADIRGSEGRTSDFDDRFNPLSSQGRQRWQSVASAIEDGVRLPPVELIQVGAEYYVRDGHHRISVAAAFGQEVIEAVVSEWSGDL